MFTLFIFFFSSRRRHTRWPRDWSSDVCSSDLPGVVGGVVRGHLLVHGPDPLGQPVQFPFRSGHFLTCCPLLGGGDLEIGRASCRERVTGSVAGGTVTQKKYMVRQKRLTGADRR